MHGCAETTLGVRPVARQAAVSVVIAIAMALGGPARATAGVANNVLAAAPAPNEADLARARELFENGRNLYEEGSYEAAIEAFVEAYDISADPNLLYNTALAYDRLEQFEQAIEFLARYRAVAPEAERAALDRKHNSMTARLEKQKRDAEAASEAGTEGDGADEPASAAPLRADGTDEGPEQPPIFGAAAAVLTATAAVGIGLGIGFGVASLRQTRAAEDECLDDNGGLLCGTGADSPKRKGRNFAIVSDVSFAVGAAAGVAAVTLVVVAAVRRKRATSTALAPTWNAGGAGLVLSGRF